VSFWGAFNIHLVIILDSLLHGAFLETFTLIASFHHQLPSCFDKTSPRSNASRVSTKYVQCDGSKAGDVDSDEDDDGNEGWIEDGRTLGYFFVLNPGGVEY